MQNVQSQIYEFIEEKKIFPSQIIVRLRSCSARFMKPYRSLAFINRISERFYETDCICGHGLL